MHTSLNNIKGDNLGFVRAEFKLGQPMSWETVNTMVDSLRKLTFGTKKATLLPDFDTRPIFFDPKADDKLPNNAVIVSTDYPYGRHRCLRASWLEKDKKGDYGFTYVTSSFNGLWNTPKRGTKSRGVGYFCEGETSGIRHITHNVFDIVWKCHGNDGRFHFEPLDKFMEDYGMTLSTDDLKKIEVYRAQMEERNKKADAATAQMS